MKGIPDVLFIIDVGYENIAVSEAVKLGIPVVGVVDSNNSPRNVDYIIPGNDDAIRSIKLYASGVADAILESRQSIAHLGDGEDNDELVEIDESGAPVDSDAAADAPKVTKKATKKKAAASAETAEAAAGEEAASKKKTKKKTAKKKVAKKTTKKKVSKKSAADAAEEEE